MRSLDSREKMGVWTAFVPIVNLLLVAILSVRYVDLMDWKCYEIYDSPNTVLGWSIATFGMLSSIAFAGWLQSRSTTILCILSLPLQFFFWYWLLVAPWVVC